LHLRDFDATVQCLEPELDYLTRTFVVPT